jgi:hypothetical protein
MRVRVAAVVAAFLMIVTAASASAAPAVGVIDLYSGGFIRAKLQVELRSDGRLQAYMFHAGGELFQPSWTTVGLCYLTYNGGPCAPGGAADAGDYGSWAGPAIPSGTAQRSIYDVNYRPWRAWGTIRVQGHDYQVSMAADTASDPRPDYYSRIQLN